MSTSTIQLPRVRQMIKPSSRRNTPALVVGVLSVVIAVLIGVIGGPAQLVTTLVTGGMWALMSVGLALIFGVMNIPHFAHGESFMAGSFTAWLVFTPLNRYLVQHPNAFLSAVAPFAGMIAAVLVGAVMGVVIERVIFATLRHRTKEGWVMNAFLLTVGLSYVLTNGTTLTLGPDYRGVPQYWDVPPLQFLGVRLTVDRLVAFTIALVVIGALWIFLQRTNTGRAIRAVSQDETGAQMVGINLDGIQTLTFALATATAALAGAGLLFMYPAYPLVGLNPLYYSWYVVMLVGLGNVPGAILGGFIVALIQTGTQQFFGISWINVIPTAIMVVVLLVAPSGIFGSEVKGVQEQ
ncbi:MAG: branched-chain amino acid ABC transporter permease [Chloroflexi bacterium]|nr:branched-chain amino acid ABC transporter permease [Chloroflexota bacterium]